MRQWLRRSAWAKHRPSLTSVITATLFGATLLLLAAGLYGLAITDLLLMYPALTLGGYALVAFGVVITHTIIKHDAIDFMQSLVWSPDGRRLAIGASFNRAIVMDALTGAHRQTLQGPLDSFNKFADKLRINSLAWSPDSRYLAVASDDTTVRIWRDEPEGKPATVFVWAGHMNNVSIVAWSPTGQSIASVDLYGVVQVWRPQGDLWDA